MADDNDLSVDDAADPEAGDGPRFVTLEDLGADTISIETPAPTVADTEPRAAAASWAATPKARVGAADGPVPEVYPPTPHATRPAPSEPVPAGDYDPQLGQYFDERDFARLPRRSGPLRRALIILGVLLVVFLVGRSAWNQWYDNQITPDGPPGETVAFRVETGWTLNQVADALESEGIVTDGFWFRRWCSGKTFSDLPAVAPAELGERAQDILAALDNSEIDGSSNLCEFQAGDYRIATNITFEAAAASLLPGPEPVEFINVRIPEGLTVDQLASRLVAENPDYSLEDIEEALAGQVIDSTLFDSDRVVFVPGFRTILEGLLFPANYDVAEDKSSDEIDILVRMARTMEARFDDSVESVGRDPIIEELGLSDYDVIIIASLIEEEAKIDADRAKIARVIYNRLVRDELLGIDATTRYAFDKAPGEPLLESELQNDTNPYNTRAVRGLPPTPIAAPGQASIEAALAPEPGEWMFYVLTNENGVDGAHHFSLDAAEHEQYVQVCRELDLGC
ncbi:MAG: endolytic transglycosylase MltG [Acidimicrobiales bacterium]|nr:endolytic transglycosylase MltG [Acidimicrobiales bacterium]